MKDLCLKKLEKELTIAKIRYYQVGSHLKLHFNNYSNPLVFSHYLDQLQTDFSNEFLSNLSGLKTIESKFVYLEYVKQGLVASIEKLGNNPNFIFPNSNQTSSADIESFCIPTQTIDVPLLISDFNIQKDGIIKSIKIVERNFLLVRYEQDKRNDFSNYWKELLFEFSPHKIRFKKEISNTLSMSDKKDKIKLLHDKIATDLLAQGVDLNNSPLDLYFEGWLDCAKDFYSSCLGSQNLIFSSLKWIGPNVDFYEIIIALYYAKRFRNLNGSPLTQKELFSQFAKFLNINPISDLTSRLCRLKTRSNQTPFLDKLKATLTLICSGEKSK